MDEGRDPSSHTCAGDARAAVVVVNYAAHGMLENALGRVEPADVDVVIVDNYSSGAERDAVTGLADRHRWELVALPDNRGYGAGVNAGVRRAAERGCDVVVILNPDARIDPAVLTELVRHSRREPNAVIAPTVVTSEGRVEFAGAFLDLADGRLRGNHGRVVERTPGELRLEDIETYDATWRGWLTGACLATSVMLLDRLGGFDESYFLYWEDVDLSLRARRLGSSLVVRTDLVVTHDEGGTQGARQGRAKSDLYYRYNTRNRLALAAALLPRRAVLRWVAMTPRVSWEILLRGGRRQLLHSLTPLLEIVRGSFAGLWLALRSMSRPPVTTIAAPVQAGVALRSVAIAVLTYRRPSELEALLPMLVEQAAAVSHRDEPCDVAVVVIDNDPDGSAEAAVRRHGADVRYVHEPVPGIAAARNRALDEAEPYDAVAFIDDDERPAPGWLACLIDTARATGAAAVAGAMVPVHDDEPERFVTAGRFFVRPRHGTGTSVRAAGAGNLLVRTEPIRRLSLRFDPDFGTTGGEDTLFTRTLTRSGERIVWCDEAVAFDRVPAARATREWVLKRAYSSGNSAGRVELRLGGGPAAQVRVRVRLLIGGTVRWIGGRLRSYYGLARGRAVDHARGLRTSQRGAGMMAGALGHTYEEYRRG